MSEKRQWVLLRGLGREQAHWKRFTDMFKEQFPNDEILGMDLPGAGEFYRVASPFSISGIAEFVQSQLLHHPSENRHIVAISLGGMVAAEIAHLYPESVKGLVLINSSFKNLSPFYHRLQLEAFMHLYRAITAESGESREQAVLDMVSNRSDKYEIAKEWAEIGRKRPVSAVNFAKQLLAAALYDLPEKTPDLQGLILSSFGDRMVDPRCSHQISETWKMPLEMHNGGGHELCLDEPQWVLDQIKKYFL